LRLLRKRPQDPEGFPKATTVSALEQAGLAAAWAEMQALAKWRRASGQWDLRRGAQAQHWFEEEVRRGLLAVLAVEPARGIMAQLGGEVAKGQSTPEAAAARLLTLLGRG
jgi:LAO/AO transport system kinase